ncbi:MAG: SRPBCC family protein [Nocardioidaceae bacterium]
MSDNSWTTEISVPHSPEQVFNAVTNVRGWWNEEIDGGTTDVGDEFTFTDHGSLRRRFRLIEVVPARRVVWQVRDSHLSFVDDHKEWTDTQVIFDITRRPDGTDLRFTHQGLRPAVECYEACSRGWDFYINQSLKNLITIGTGQPIPMP